MAGVNSISDLIKQAALELYPVPPDGVLIQRAYAAMDDACTLANCWREKLLSIAAVAGQTTYQLTWTFDATLGLVWRVRLDGVDVPAECYQIEDGNTPDSVYLVFEPWAVPQTSTTIAAYDADTVYPAGSKVAHGGKYYRNPVQVGPEAWDATHWVETCDGLHVWVSLIPEMGGTEFSPNLWRYWKLFRAGIVANVKSGPPPYRDLASVSAWQVVWDNGIAEATNDGITDERGGIVISEVIAPGR